MLSLASLPISLVHSSDESIGSIMNTICKDYTEFFAEDKLYEKTETHINDELSNLCSMREAIETLALLEILTLKLKEKIINLEGFSKKVAGESSAQKQDSMYESIAIQEKALNRILSYLVIYAEKCQEMSFPLQYKMLFNEEEANLFRLMNVSDDPEIFRKCLILLVNALRFGSMTKEEIPAFGLGLLRGVFEYLLETPDFLVHGLNMVWTNYEEEENEQSFSLKVDHGTTKEPDSPEEDCEGITIFHVKSPKEYDRRACAMNILKTAWIENEATEAKIKKRPLKFEEFEYRPEYFYSLVALKCKKQGCMNFSFVLACLIILPYDPFSSFLYQKVMEKRFPDSALIGIKMYVHKYFRRNYDRFSEAEKIIFFETYQFCVRFRPLDCVEELNFLLEGGMKLVDSGQITLAVAFLQMVNVLCENIMKIIENSRRSNLDLWEDVDTNNKIDEQKRYLELISEMISYEKISDWLCESTYKNIKKFLPVLTMQLKINESTQTEGIKRSWNDLIRIYRMVFRTFDDQSIGNIKINDLVQFLETFYSLYISFFEPEEENNESEEKQEDYVFKEKNKMDFLCVTAKLDEIFSIGDKKDKLYFYKIALGLNIAAIDPDYVKMNLPLPVLRNFFKKAARTYYFVKYEKRILKVIVHILCWEQYFMKGEWRRNELLEKQTQDLLQIIKRNDNLSNYFPQQTKLIDFSQFDKEFYYVVFMSQSGKIEESDENVLFEYFATYWHKQNYYKIKKYLKYANKNFKPHPKNSELSVSLLKSYKSVIRKINHSDIHETPFEELINSQKRTEFFYKGIQDIIFLKSTIENSSKLSDFMKIEKNIRNDKETKFDTSITLETFKELLSNIGRKLSKIFSSEAILQSDFDQERLFQRIIEIRFPQRCFPKGSEIEEPLRKFMNRLDCLSNHMNLFFEWEASAGKELKQSLLKLLISSSDFKRLSRFIFMYLEFAIKGYVMHIKKLLRRPLIFMENVMAAVEPIKSPATFLKLFPFLRKGRKILTWLFHNDLLQEKQSREFFDAFQADYKAILLRFAEDESENATFTSMLSIPQLWNFFDESVMLSREKLDYISKISQKVGLFLSKKEISESFLQSKPQKMGLYKDIHKDPEGFLFSCFFNSDHYFNCLLKQPMLHALKCKWNAQPDVDKKDAMDDLELDGYISTILENCWTFCTKSVVSPSNQTMARFDFLEVFDFKINLDSYNEWLLYLNGFFLLKLRSLQNFHISPESFYKKIFNLIPKRLIEKKEMAVFFINLLEVCIKDVIKEDRNIKRDLFELHKLPDRVPEKLLPILEKFEKTSTEHLTSFSKILAIQMIIQAIAVLLKKEAEKNWFEVFKSWNSVYTILLTLAKSMKSMREKQEMKDYDVNYINQMVINTFDLFFNFFAKAQKQIVIAELKNIVFEVFNSYIDVHTLVARSGRFMMKRYLKGFLSIIYFVLEECREQEVLQQAFHIIKRYPEIRAIKFKNYSSGFSSETFRIIDTIFEKSNIPFLAANFEVVLKTVLFDVNNLRDLTMEELCAEEGANDRLSLKIKDSEINKLGIFREVYSEVFYDTIKHLFAVTHDAEKRSSTVMKLKSPKNLHLIETAPTASLNKFQEQIIKFFVDESLKHITNILNSYGAEYTSMPKPEDCMIPVLTFDYSKRILAMLMLKYPLLIPYLANYGLSTSELKKNIKNESFYACYVSSITNDKGEVTLLDFLFEIERLFSFQMKSHLLTALLKSNYKIYYDQHGRLRKITESWSSYWVDRMNMGVIQRMQNRASSWDTQEDMLILLNYINRIQDFLHINSEQQSTPSTPFYKKASDSLKVFLRILNEVPRDFSFLLTNSKFFDALNSLYIVVSSSFSLANFFRTMSLRRYFYDKHFKSLIKSSSQASPEEEDKNCKRKEGTLRGDDFRMGIQNASSEIEKHGKIEIVAHKQVSGAKVSGKYKLKLKNDMFIKLFSEFKNCYEGDHLKLSSIFESIKNTKWVLNSIFKDQRFFYNLEGVNEYSTIDMESIELVKKMTSTKSSEDNDFIDMINIFTHLSKEDEELPEEIPSKKELPNIHVAEDDCSMNLGVMSPRGGVMRLISGVEIISASPEEEKSNEEFVEEEEKQYINEEFLTEELIAEPCIARDDLLRAQEESLVKFNLEEKGFPPDALELYNIDKEAFAGLSEELQIEVLTRAKEEYMIQLHMLSRQEMERKLLSVLEQEEKRAVGETFNVTQQVESKVSAAESGDDLTQLILEFSEPVREKLLQAFTAQSVQKLKSEKLVSMFEKRNTNSQPLKPKDNVKEFEDLRKKISSWDKFLYRVHRKPTKEDQNLLDDESAHKGAYAFEDCDLEKIFSIMNFNLSCIRKTKLFSESLDDKCDTLIEMLKTISFDAPTAIKVLDYLLFSGQLYADQYFRGQAQSPPGFEPEEIFTNAPANIYPEQTQLSDGVLCEKGDQRLVEKLTRILGIITQFLENDLCLKVFFEGFFDPYEGISFADKKPLPSLNFLKTLRNSFIDSTCKTRRKPIKQYFSQFLWSSSTTLTDSCFEIIGTLNERIIPVPKEDMALVKFPNFALLTPACEGRLAAGDREGYSLTELSEELICKIFENSSTSYSNFARLLPLDEGEYASGLIKIIEWIIHKPNTILGEFCKSLKHKKDMKREVRLPEMVKLFSGWEMKMGHPFFDRFYRFFKDMYTNILIDAELMWDRRYCLRKLKKSWEKLSKVDDWVGKDEEIRDLDILKSYRDSEKKFIDGFKQQIKTKIFENHQILKFFNRIVKIIHYFQIEGLTHSTFVSGLQYGVDAFCVLVNLFNKDAKESTSEAEAQLGDQLPALSGMMSCKAGHEEDTEKLNKEASMEPAAQAEKSSKQITIESVLMNLIKKVSNLLSETNQKKDDIVMESYGYFIENYPGCFEISTQTKFDFLKSAAKKQVDSRKAHSHRLELKIDRQQIWTSTIRNLMKADLAYFVLGHIKISFENEGGYDMGGLRNEWLTLTAAELLNPNFGLFKLSPNKLSLQPNPFSSLVPDHLMHFQYLGRLIGKCLIDDLPFQVTFVKFFLKHILRKSLTIEDLEDVDPSLYKSIKWLLDTNIAGFEDLHITFM